MPRRASTRRRRRSSDQERLVAGPPTVQATRRGSSSGATLERARRLGHRAEAVVGTVQRLVDLDDLNGTANDQYYVDPNDREALYSVPNAAPPEPRGLYYHDTDTTTDDGNVHVWRPNARLISGNEQVQNARPLTQQVSQVNVGGDLADLPQFGLLGKNDCNYFASVLQTLIATDRGQFANQDVEPTDYDLSQPNVNAPQIGIGDKMKHLFQGGNGCPYHAATVVAEDGGSKVTLEGHVSQNLVAPHFHIRNGVAGFVQDNNQNRDNGQVVKMEMLADITQDNAQDTLQDMRSKFDKMSGVGNLGGMQPEWYAKHSLGMTQRPGQLIAQERDRREQVARANRRRQALQLINTLVTDERWSDQGAGLIGTKLPGGVKSIRRALAGGFLVQNRTTQEKLEYCRAKGADKLNAPDDSRSQATTDLYTALSHLNPANPNIGTLTNELATARNNL